jgi:hypothetical protein
MPKPESKPTRGQLKVWLKWAVQSDPLEKLPPRCDLEDLADPPDTEEVAHRLLAELRDPESNRRPISRITADIERFRRWVETRQKINRQLILTEVESARTGPELLETRRAVVNRSDDQERGRTARRRIAPGSDPMWDQDLDG